MKKVIICCIFVISHLFLYSQYFYPPENVNAYVTDLNNVTIEWDAPSYINYTSIQHHTGYDNNGIGTGSPVNFICAARFDANDLDNYYGTHSITEVNIICHSADFDYVAIQVYEGGCFGDPGILVYEHEITNTIVPQEWTNHVLSYPIQLVSGNEYWLAYDIHATGDHPAAVDMGPMVPDKGGWMYYNDIWQTLLDLGLNYNWIITGILDEHDSQNVTISTHNKNKKSIKSEISTSNPQNGGFSLGHRSTEIPAIADDSRYLSGYKVYRDGSEIAEINGPTTLTYTDEALSSGIYDYYVTAIYLIPSGESEPSNTDQVSVTLPAPYNANAEIIGPNVILVWNPPTRDFESYNVYRNGVVIINNITTTMYIDIAPPTGNYCYNITAVYTGGAESYFSNDAIVIMSSNPGTIEGNVTLNYSQGSIDETLLHFDELNIYPDSTGFYSSNSVPGIFSLTASLCGFETLTLTDIEIFENQTTIVNFSLDPLDIPEITTLTVNENDIYLEWSMLENSDSDDHSNSYNRTLTLSGFYIYRNDDLITEINDPEVMQYNDTALDSGNYIYTIRAVYDEINFSFPSDEEFIVVILLPPQNLTLISLDFDILLEWEAPNYNRDFTVYRVYKDSDFISVSLDTTYIDENIPSGAYTYYITAVYYPFESNPSNVETIYHTSTNENLIISTTKLIGNYPNPFNPETIISYQLQENSTVELAIYNIKGQKVKTLVNEILPAGGHSVIWDGKDFNDNRVGSGIYFYKLIVGDYQKVKKMLLLK